MEERGHLPVRCFPHWQCQTGAKSLGRGLVPAPAVGSHTARAPHGWEEGMQPSRGNRKEMHTAASPSPSNKGQLTLPPLHPLPSTRVSVFGVSYWLPSWLLLQVPAALRHRVPVHHRRRLCRRIKPPRQSQDTFAISAGDSGGSGSWLQCWCSEPPYQTCHRAFHSRRRYGRSAWCVLSLPLLSCVRSHCKAQGRRLLVLCCSIIPLKDELFCLPSPAPVSSHHQPTRHTHPSMALPHTMRDTWGREPRHFPCFQLTAL